MAGRRFRSKSGERQDLADEIVQALGFALDSREIRLRVGGQPLTAVITADAVRALKLRRGEDAIAIIKSTEVMIAREP